MMRAIETDAAVNAATGDGQTVAAAAAACSVAAGDAGDDAEAIVVAAAPSNDAADGKSHDNDFRSLAHILEKAFSGFFPQLLRCTMPHHTSFWNMQMPRREVPLPPITAHFLSCEKHLVRTCSICTARQKEAIERR